MIELSTRMKMNADLVPPGCSLADIGCDHGYVSIYLSHQKRCQNIIAMDVNKGPLAIAKQNIFNAQLQDKINCRLSDGLEKLMPNEVNAILIAGMGGMLICKILQAKPEVVQNLNTLIIQAQSDLSVVRQTIWKLGFFIEEEKMCKDAGKFYLAMRAVRGQEKTLYTEDECTYGRILAQKKDEVYKEWLQAEIEKRKDVICHLMKQESEEIKVRIDELQAEQKAMQHIMNHYYGG